MYSFVNALSPIFVFFALPVSIVWIICRASSNKDNKTAEIITKAIECNTAIDTDKIIEAFNKIRKTPLQILQQRLLRGCIFTLIGLASIICCIYSYRFADMMPEALFLFIQIVTMLVTGISLAVGIAYLIVFFVTRKSVNDNREN